MDARKSIRKNCVIGFSVCFLSVVRERTIKAFHYGLGGVIYGGLK